MLGFDGRRELYRPLAGNHDSNEVDGCRPPATRFVVNSEDLDTLDTIWLSSAGTHSERERERERKRERLGSWTRTSRHERGLDWWETQSKKGRSAQLIAPNHVLASSQTLKPSDPQTLRSCRMMCVCVCKCTSRPGSLLCPFSQHSFAVNLLAKLFDLGPVKATSQDSGAQQPVNAEAASQQFGNSLR